MRIETIMSLTGLILSAGCCTSSPMQSYTNKSDSESIKEALHVPVLLTWIDQIGPDGIDPNQAIFFLDGRLEGKGEAGFAQVLRDIDQFKGTRPIVESYHSGNGSPSRPPYYMPYDAWDLGDQYFHRIRDDGLDVYPVEFDP